MSESSSGRAFTNAGEGARSLSYPARMQHTHTRGAVVSVGDELALGQTLDTNSKWVSARLRDLGLSVVEHVTVPDDLERLAAALRRLAGGVDLLICTGGLGPTADDLTRQALAAAMDDALVEDAASLAQIEAFFSSRKRSMPAMNRVQARRPSRAEALVNPNGTAPGVRGVVGRCEVLCLPGPPAEMRPMFEAEVTPRVRLPVGRLVRTRVLHCVGIGESDLATRLGPLMDRTHSPLVGTTASGGVVSVRIRCEGVFDESAAMTMLDETERHVREVAGDFVFGSGDDSLASVVLARLASSGRTLGCVESCTGGGLGAMLTEVAGASVVFRGGLVTYANDLKASLANVDAGVITLRGAVSAEVAMAMAAGGLDRLGVDHCLAITGIAGPEGGTPQKPVGTVWVGRASRDAGLEARRFAMAGDRESVRRWSSVSALAALWQHLAGRGGSRLLREVERRDAE